MTINIDNILKKNNKTRYWLSKEIGYTYQNLANLCNNNIKSIRFEVLEKTCKALKCDVGDILIIDK